jgi:ArsR family transcriptional regulator, arsenate/arsenite/antimonite-responsive transcriptional repressor
VKSALVSVAKAIADQTRVRIIAALRHEELCVYELVDALEIAQSTLSTHLQVCRQANLVTTRKDSRWIYYSISRRYSDLIETIFSHFRLPESDKQILRDAKRLKTRLAMRKGGRCVVGSQHGTTQKTSGLQELPLT